ncbi:hypothetical protein V2J09_005023 [Rumex salicifolius]
MKEDRVREAAIDAKQDDELDLNLGLWLEPRHHLRNLGNPVVGDDSSLTMPIWGKVGTRSEQELDRLSLTELRGKRVLQALRRLEARKKRDDKRKLKSNALAGDANERLLRFEDYRVAGRERDGADFEGLRLGSTETRAKRELQALRRHEARKKRDDKRKLKANALAGNASEKLLWFERAAGRESDGGDSERLRKGGNWNCNAATTPFLVRPACKLDCSQSNVMMAEKNSGLVVDGVSDQLKRSVSSCSRGSSSGVSDYQSTSSQGGSSSDGGSHSSHSSYPLDLTIKNCSTTFHHNSQQSAPNSIKSKPSCSVSTYQLEPVEIPMKVQSQTNSSNLDQSQTSPSKREVTKGDKLELRKPPKPKTHLSNRPQLFPNMPCVATTGNGPNGKRITGFLYKYTKLEVSIVCICHGTSFSPAGFVEHAGGVGIENPLRHITISPSASN